MTETVHTTLRMPRSLWNELHDRHAATFHHHRLSFNAYLVAILQLSAEETVTSAKARRNNSPDRRV
ncbi:MAG: hypothetical protein HY874_07295 [Chloroflexi bacterium]|nr:hypothetical protein [Chloroflexota bacterium]